MALPDITTAKKQLVSLLDSAAGTISGEELVNRMLEMSPQQVILVADGNAASAVAQTLWFVNDKPYPVFVSRATLRCEANVAGDATNIGTINLAADDGAGGSKVNFATINTLNTNYVAGVGQTFTITPTSQAGALLAAGAGVYYQQTKGASGVAFPLRALTAVLRKG